MMLSKARTRPEIQKPWPTTYVKGVPPLSFDLWFSGWEISYKWLIVVFCISHQFSVFRIFFSFFRIVFTKPYFDEKKTLGSELFRVPFIFVPTLQATATLAGTGRRTFTLLLEKPLQKKAWHRNTSGSAGGAL